MAAAYDGLATIYDAWIESSGPELEQIRQFYAARYLAADGPVAELGVGNGRILIDAARAGRSVIGVDGSRAMLDLCRSHAERAGVLDRLTLIQADFCSFQLEQPAALIAVPYDSIGHLLTPQDRRRFVRHVFGQLRPGGLLMFDQALHDTEAAARVEGQPHFRAWCKDETTGQDALLWFTPHQDVRLRLRSAAMFLTDADGQGPPRMLGVVENSWFRDAAEVRDLLSDAGFAIAGCHGDFEGGPLRSDSEYQVWTARRPG